MAYIRATCRHCGDVEFGSRNTVLRRCVDNGSSLFVFRCPSCGSSCTTPVGPDASDRLIEAGVTLTEWRLPAELQDPARSILLRLDEIDVEAMAAAVRAARSVEDLFGPLP